MDQEWNPMKQAYADKHFNRYNQGVGRDLLGSVGSDQGIKLYAQNVPVTLGQEGFKNLFAEYGTVIDSKLLKPKEDSQSTIGFVTMKNLVDANTAISKLDKKKIARFTIRVSPALTEEEKEQRKRLKQQEKEFIGAIVGNDDKIEDDDAVSQSSSFSINSSVRQPLNKSGLQGRGLDLDRNAWHSLSKAAEEGTRSVPKLAISIGQGSPRKVQEKGDSIHLPHEDLLQSLGRGRAAQPQLLKGGLLGQAPGRGIPNQLYREPLLLRPGVFGRGRSFGAPVGNKQIGGEGYFSAPGKPQPSKSIIEPPKSSQVEGVKLCVFCYKKGCVYLCSRCRMYYCSADCQKKDWPRHQNVCISIGEHLRNGDITTSNSTKRNTKCYDTDTDSLASPNKGKREKKKGKRNYDSDTAEDKRLLQDTFRNLSNKSAAKENDGKQSLPMMKDRTSKNSDNSGDISSSEDEPVRSQNGREREPKSSGVQLAASIKENTKPAEMTPVPAGNKGSPISKQLNVALEAAKTEPQASQVLDRGESTKTTIRKMSLEAGDATTYVPEFSLPIGSSGQAFVTYYESPYKFWICLQDYMETFSELMVFMDQQFSQKAYNKTLCPKVGEMYAAVAMDEWSRLRVVSVREQEVTAYFVDYGNTATVKWSDLRPLTEDMLIVPAQAICCCVSKMKPINSESWSDEVCSAVQSWLGVPLTKSLTYEVVAVKGSVHAMKVLMNGEALSEMLLSNKMGERMLGNSGLSGFSSSKKKESRFMVDSLPSGIPECNERDKLSVILTDIQSTERFAVLCSASSKTIEELSVLLQGECLDRKAPYRPVKGELVAGKFSKDGIWYRSEVTSVQGDTFTLFFMDYGNSETQTEDNIRQLKEGRLREIPAQAVVCRLLEVKTPPDVNEQVILQEFKNLLVTSFLDESGGLSLIVKGKVDGHLVVDLVTESGVLFTKAFSERLAELSKAAQNDSTKALISNVKASSTLTQENYTQPEKNIESSAVADVEVEHFPQVGGETVRVNVSYVKDCSEFYVRLYHHHDDFISVMRELNMKVDKSPVLASPMVGTVAAVQFSQDHIWYRGKVEKRDGTRYQVRFIDYGNCEMAGSENLRELPPSVRSLPAQAIKCRLSGDHGQLSETTHKTFKQQAEDRFVDLKMVERDSSGISVQIFVDGSDLGECLLRMEDSREDSPASVSNRIPGLKLEQKVLVPVECVNMVSPTEFYVQVSEYIPAAVEATLRLKTRLEEKPQPAKEVSPGDFVAAKFSQDSEVIWYRVRVESISGSRCTIFFLDYGNFEETSVTELMQLASEDFTTPACTIKCRLVNSGTPSAKLKKKFSELSPSQIVSIQVVSQEKDECVVDILDSDGKCITSMFTEQETRPPQPQAQILPLKPQPSKELPSPGVQKKSIQIQTLPCAGELVPVVVTHVESCSCIYVSSKVEHLQSELLQLMIKLNKLGDSLPKLVSPTSGIICAAQFTQDNSWYRAQIDKMCDSTMCVIHYVDYGNSEKTSIAELREIPMELTQLPAQAICCCLQGYESVSADGSNDETAKLNQKLKEDLLEKQVNVKVIDRKNKAWIVKMENEHGECIGSKYKPIHSQATPNLSDLIFETPSQVEFNGVIFHTNNLSDFYVQRVDPKELQELKRMSQKLEQDVGKLDADVHCDPVVDGIYTSEYQGSWYRCVVQEVKGPKVHVRYIDYGNSEEIPVTHLRPINQERLAMPVRLIRCKLYGVIPLHPDWNCEGMAQYLEILQQRMIDVVIEGEEEDILLVSLYMVDGADRVSVASDLVTINFAKFDDKAGQKRDVEDAQSKGAKKSQEQEVAEDEDEEELEIQRKIHELQQQLALSKQKKNKSKG